MKERPIATVTVPESVVKDNFSDVMICKGNCMAPTITDGAVIGFDRNDTEIIVGEIYIFKIRGKNPPYQTKRVTRYDPPRVGFPGLIVLGTDNLNFLNWILNLSDIEEVAGKVKWICNDGHLIDWKVKIKPGDIVENFQEVDKYPHGGFGPLL